MTNQLSKAQLKTTAAILEHLKDRYAQTAASINALQSLLAESGASAPSLNGHGAAQDGPSKAERIVERAKARFARHAPQRPARAAGTRMTPEAWQARIVDILTARGGPMHVRDIWRQSGLKSNAIFKYLTAAVKAGVISRVPGPKGVYVLGRHAASHAPSAKPKKKPRFGKGVKMQRQRSLDLLNAFSPDTPRPLGAQAGYVGKLISHGYLKRTKDGYLRTAKVYEVTPS